MTQKTQEQQVAALEKALDEARSHLLTQKEVDELYKQLSHETYLFDRKTGQRVRNP